MRDKTILKLMWGAVGVVGITAATGLWLVNKKVKPLVEPPAKAPVTAPAKTNTTNKTNPMGDREFQGFIEELQGEKKPTDKDARRDQLNDLLRESYGEGIEDKESKEGNPEPKKEISELFSDFPESDKTDEEILDMIEDEQDLRFASSYITSKVKNFTPTEKEFIAQASNSVGSVWLSSFIEDMGHEYLNVLRYIAEETTDKQDLYSNFNAFKALVRNPNFGRESVDEDFVKLFVDTVNYINSKIPCVVYGEHGNSALAGLFGNPNFSKKTPFEAKKFSDTVNKLIEGRDKEDAFNILGLAESAFSNPNFKQEMLGEQFAKELILIAERHSFFDNPVISHCLVHLYRNPDFWYEQEDFNKAKEIMTLLGVSGKEEEINFGYAVHVLGVEKTMELHRKCGIVHFARYGKNTLEKAYETLNSEYIGGNLTALMFAMDDWNGGFYQDREALEILQKNPILIYELDSDKEFFDTVNEIHENYGKIGIMVIAGHGTPKSIQFGKGNGDKKCLDVSDKNPLYKIKDVFIEDPQIILTSCESGKGEKSIAALISDVWDAELWAPYYPSVGFNEESKDTWIRLVLGPPKPKEILVLDDEGRIEKIHLSGNVRRFVDGVEQ